MYWGVLAGGEGVIAGSVPPNIPCFLFQGPLSQLGITHLRRTCQPGPLIAKGTIKLPRKSLPSLKPGKTAQGRWRELRAGGGKST